VVAGLVVASLVTGHGSFSGGRGCACVWSYPSMKLLQLFPGYSRRVDVIQQSDELCFTGAQKIEVHRYVCPSRVHD